MRSEPVNRLGLKSLIYWRWSGFLRSLLWWLIPIIYYVLSLNFSFLDTWIVFILVALSIILTFLETIVFPKIIWERWRYEILEHDIDLCYGLWNRKRTIIPMVKVQHVDTKQGPLMRKFDLSSVSISTAAGPKKIPALNKEVADSLRDRISVLARAVEDDV